APVAVPASGNELSNLANNTINIRFLTVTNNMRPTDSVWAYPYPPKPPKQIIPNPLPQTEAQLKNMILSTGYSARQDISTPYPLGGVRWQRAFANARKKAGLGYAHTMLTMYPWVNKMFPYVQTECLEMNRIEQERS